MLILHSLKHFLFLYDSYIFCGVLLIILLLLPIQFKNWDDDLPSIITYISMIAFFTALTFLIILPLVFEFESFNLYANIFLVVGSCLFALVKVIKQIPLEKTFLIQQDSLVTVSKISIFQDFFGQERASELFDIDFSKPDGDFRYNALRQRLLRKKSKDIGVVE